MANLEHVEIVKQGKDAIDGWRKAHPDERLDLVDARLSQASLEGARLMDADLAGADLRHAMLSGAYLRRAKLAKVYLAGAILWTATLSDADLSGANLSGLDLTKSRTEADSDVTPSLGMGMVIPLSQSTSSCRLGCQG